MANTAGNALEVAGKVLHGLELLAIGAEVAFSEDSQTTELVELGADLLEILQSAHASVERSIRAMRTALEENRPPNATERAAVFAELESGLQRLREAAGGEPEG